MPPRTAALALVLSALLAGCATTPNGQGPPQIGLDGSLRLARAALAGGDIDAGIRLLRHAVELEPQATTARASLAAAYYEIGAYPEAQTAYDELAKLDPASVDPLVGRGRIALSTGQPEAAIAQFERALAKTPGDPRALNGLAVAYDFIGRHGEAQAIYADLLRHDPSNRGVANNLALSRALAGDLGTAIEELSVLADGPAVVPQARHNLALAYALEGDDTVARDLLRRELQPREVAENIAFYEAVRAAREPRPLTPGRLPSN